MKVEGLQRLWFLDGATQEPTGKEEPFMGSMQGLVGRGKKSRRLGKVEVVERANCEVLELDTKTDGIMNNEPLRVA